ncbi:MAG TPA: hypothetical protein VMU31_05645 [Rhizomicrobium sp.]|nr:hypothetical protein [Rhizomicrobium sp.]
MDKPLEQIFLHCRKCGTSGVAIWELPAPDFPDDRRLVSLSDGFYQRPLVGVLSPEIICDHCGTGQPS